MSYSHYGSQNRMIDNTPSTVQKMKETYWTTKQAVMKKLGKKEDESLISSDAQLDAKLEVFKAVQNSCSNLQRCIEIYQDRLCILSQEENSMGRFLKSASQADKTRAGEIMCAVGKAQGASSQQRLALRTPLMRLYSELDTFRNRAIEDTLQTVNLMEQSRTEYRGALLWMKDGSNNLDPDTHKQLEKFRKVDAELLKEVQMQVKKTKVRFDKLKLDCMQKIDLLVASRCNMFSQSLAVYQTALLAFWSKTSSSMTRVAEAFKGYQYFEFNLLKILDEPVKELAKQTAGNGKLKDTEDTKEAKDRHNNSDDKSRDANDDNDADDDGLIKFDKTEDVKIEEDNFLSFCSEVGANLESHDNGKSLSEELIEETTPKPKVSEMDDFLGSFNTTSEGFSTEWTQVFGNSPASPLKKPSVMTPSNFMETDNVTASPAVDLPLLSHLPSSLLTDNFDALNLKENVPLKHKDLKKPEADKSDWFKLFADLDPLANPDAIGNNDTMEPL